MGEEQEIYVDQY